MHFQGDLRLDAHFMGDSLTRLHFLLLQRFGTGLHSFMGPNYLLGLDTYLSTLLRIDQKIIQQIIVHHCHSSGKS